MKKLVLIFSLTAGIILACDAAGSAEDCFTCTDINCWESPPGSGTTCSIVNGTLGCTDSWLRDVPLPSPDFPPPAGDNPPDND